MMAPITTSRGRGYPKGTEQHLRASSLAWPMLVLRFRLAARLDQAQRKLLAKGGSNMLPSPAVPLRTLQLQASQAVCSFRMPALYSNSPEPS